MNTESVRAWLSSGTAAPDEIEVVRSRFEAAEKLFVFWDDSIELMLMEQCWQRREQIFGEPRTTLLIKEWWLEVPAHGHLLGFTFSGEPPQNNQYPVMITRDTRENYPYTASGLDFVLVFARRDS